MPRKETKPEGAAQEPTAPSALEAARIAQQEAKDAEVEAVLNDPGVNAELKRKLSYCQRNLTGARKGDALLLARRRELLAEAARRGR